ncbi:MULTISPECIES: XAC0095 family protein [Xanthomonas]|uniref:XAC0095-like domain-containing protein n=1 Tax=Xanthomonas cucurbitae TaxID=56453 RepID=A0A2S7DKE8_9XANT|nr:hypothetical protein [Xanthomonas cucurbitae]PPU74282.1 hypothetical protein XcuCFBP2542_15570 [Xanthomonas cucurbitae]QHG86388.1 hypothetical protein EBN15_04670 [Xanthomonas cucurbitae]WDM68641.1 hypothetical protein K6981_04940 [Xanthomonas cucurbitae]WDM72515.1 hypothetical protein K6978_04935 [Xanthomonas cucurbitae]WDM76305.1 hypothetical protein K6982_04645 [Xanthomonas cucurbitae]
MAEAHHHLYANTGYYLPEHAQYRLQQLRDHMRFLARLAQPRAQAEEQLRQPSVCVDALGFCLELLSEQLNVLLVQLQ